MFLAVGGERVAGIADPTRENTSPDGKASSVQFLRFPFTAGAEGGVPARPAPRSWSASTTANYGHMAVMPEPVRAALAGDLS